MKNILVSFLALGIGLLPVSVPLIAQTTDANTQNLQDESIEKLLEQASQQVQQRQNQLSIKTYQQALELARQTKNQDAEAAALFGIGSNYIVIGQPQKALEFFEPALSISRAISFRPLEAEILKSIGAVYDAIEQPQKALEFFKQALPIFRDLGNHYRSQTADTLNNIAEVYRAIGQPQKALEFFNQALPILREVGSPREEAVTLNNIAEVYSASKQPQKALEFFNQALGMAQEAREKGLQAKALLGIGRSNDNLGQRQKALIYYNQALLIFREEGVHEPSLEATTLHNIGRIYDFQGITQIALDYYNQALKIFRGIDRLREADVLNDIGAVYDTMGRPEEAIDYYKQALQIFEELRGSEKLSKEERSEALSGKGTVLNNIGEAYRILQQPLDALKKYKQALTIFRDLRNPLEEAKVLNNMGIAFSMVKKPQIALNYYEQSLVIREKKGDRIGKAKTLNNIGETYHVILKKPRKALKYYKQALELFRDNGEVFGEARALNNIGFVYRTIGQPKTALKHYKQALEISEKIGDRLGEATMLSNIGVVYQNMRRPSEAVKYWEKSVNITLKIRGDLRWKNRQQFLQIESATSIPLVYTLIKQKNDSRAYEWVNLATSANLVDYSRLINAKVAIPKVQQKLDTWNQKNRELQTLYTQLEKKFSGELPRKIRDKEQEVFKEGEKISRDFPEIAELVETKRQDIAKFQASIPQGSVVIHPVMLTKVQNVPNIIAIFVITKDKLSVIEKPIYSTDFDTLVTKYREQLRNPTDRNFSNTREQLYNILIRPVEKVIGPASLKQLSIIATGKLRYIPFETLYDKNTQQYLIEKYPVNYLTRLSTHSLQQQVNRKPSNLSVLAFGNPKPVDPYALNGAEEEVTRITEVFGGEVYTRERATFSTFEVQALRFPILHLATHGCFNPQGCCLGKPEDCDKPNKVQHLRPNTILFADRQYDIANAALLRLKDIELITLSACETAQEVNANGEEIAGLAYIFERAGARSVIASLWKADDETSQKIMIQFYKNLKKGMSKGNALRRAKISQIMQNPDLHPFKWSPLILIGDAR